MPGLTHALDIARRAMNTQQSIMSVIGHNVANANTPGYTRQVPQLASEPASIWMTHSYGNGVRFETVQRKRDTVLDHELRGDLSNLSRWSTRAEQLGTLEGIVNEPSDSSVGAALDAFWNSWSELSADPVDMTRRAAVREEGRMLAHRLQIMGDRLEQTGRDIDTEIGIRTDEFNLLLSDLRNLNVTIRDSQLRGLTPNDLKDRRDLLLDQLSELAPITYAEREDGILSIRLGGATILDEAIHRPLEVTVDTTATGEATATVRLSNGQPAEITRGALGSLLELRHETLPDFVAEVELLAASLITNVNALHRAGPSGADFFAGSGLSDIEISPEIESDLAGINASTSGLPGDNDIALALAELRDGRVLDGSSIGEYWNGVTGRLGINRREAQFQEESFTLSSEALEQRRQSQSGVSLDEEMANLLVAQQSFVAAVRIFETVDAMMDVLMGL
jgi:flagellar hook-associated protein 1 FlgK